MSGTFGRGGSRSRGGTRSLGRRLPGWVANPLLDVDPVNDRVWTGTAETTIAAYLADTRAASAYYTKADGTLQSFASNALRYGTNGLLVEGARTNSIQRSQELSNAYWSNGGLTITDNAAAAPDGTTTAARLLPTAASNLHRFFVSSGGTTSAGAYSAYVKANGYTKAAIREDATGGSYASFLLSGAGSLLDSSGTLSTGITALGNGWYRISFTCAAVTFPGAGIGVYVLQPGYTTGNPATVWTANGTDSIYAWGVQLEAGASITSYIPTISGTATRAADSIAMTIPAGVGNLVYTFDDASQQTVSVSPGAYTIPTNLNRPYVSRIGGTA